MYEYEKRHASSFEGTGRKEMLSCFDNANGDWLLCRDPGNQRKELDNTGTPVNPEIDERAAAISQ